jgi:hypothetical protein
LLSLFDVLSQASAAWSKVQEHYEQSVALQNELDVCLYIETRACI